jgi:hypothetical protein
VGLFPEVTVTIGLRTTAATAIAAVILLMPALGEAQGRRAVPRPVPSRPAVSTGVYYAPSVYYRPWYTSFGFGFGFGAPFYPYWGASYWGAPYWGAPYFPYYGGWYAPYYYDSSLRLQVSPRETEVFIDGYYAGTVDDFDGVFQRLHLEPGDHDLELFLGGHRSFQQKIFLQRGRTFNVRHGMEPLGPGEAEPTRPTAPPRPAASARARPPQRQPPIRPRDRDPDVDRAPDQAPPAKSDFGSLVLRVQPGDANITIDGEAWENSGDNGRLIVQLGAGVHSLQIRKDGYRTYMTDVTVKPGETTTLNVAMTPNQ